MLSQTASKVQAESWLSCVCIQQQAIGSQSSQTHQLSSNWTTGHEHQWGMLWWGCPSAMLLISVVLQSAILLDYRPLSKQGTILQPVTHDGSQQPAGDACNS